MSARFKTGAANRPRVLDMDPLQTLLDHPFHDQHATPCPLGASGQPAHGEALLRAFAGASPAWVDGLMALRNRVVSRLGLKTGPMSPAAADPATLDLRVGQTLGLFRILHTAPGCAVIGENDRHLDFRIVIQHQAPADGPARLVVGTGVRPHNLLGWAYLAAVWPAHWVISKVMVRRVAQALGGVTRSPLGS
jgi:hypothetical protein